MHPEGRLSMSEFELTKSAEDAIAWLKQSALFLVLAAHCILAALD